MIGTGRHFEHRGNAVRRDHLLPVERTAPFGLALPLGAAIRDALVCAALLVVAVVMLAIVAGAFS